MITPMKNQGAFGSTCWSSFGFAEMIEGLRVICGIKFHLLQGYHFYRVNISARKGFFNLFACSSSSCMQWWSVCRDEEWSTQGRVRHYPASIIAHSPSTDHVRCMLDIFGLDVSFNLTVPSHGTEASIPLLL
jgi:hypothetical protein